MAADRQFVVAQDGDTVFYTEAEHPTTRSRVTVTIDINWLLLARQKLRLLGVIGDRDNDLLDGLVHLVDYIQDEGDRQGHPVVWFTPAREEENE